MGVWGLGAAELVSMLGRRLAIDSGGSQVNLFPKTAYRHCNPKRQCSVRSLNIFIRVGIGGPFVHVLTVWLWFHLHPPLVIYTPSPAKFVFVFFLFCTFIFSCLHVFFYPSWECLKIYITVLVCFRFAIFLSCYIYTSIYIYSRETYLQNI